MQHKKRVPSPKPASCIPQNWETTGIKQLLLDVKAYISEMERMELSQEM
jgi:hypothetical protein